MTATAASPIEVEWVTPHPSVDPAIHRFAYLAEEGVPRLATLRRETSGPDLLGYSVTWATPEDGWSATDRAFLQKRTFRSLLMATHYVEVYARLYARRYLAA
jgi:hypothetical protein